MVRRPSYTYLFLERHLLFGRNNIHVVAPRYDLTWIQRHLQPNKQLSQKTNKPESWLTTTAQLLSSAYHVFSHPGKRCKSPPAPWSVGTWWSWAPATSSQRRKFSWESWAVWTTWTTGQSPFLSYIVVMGKQMKHDETSSVYLNLCDLFKFCM